MPGAGAGSLWSGSRKGPNERDSRLWWALSALTPPSPTLWCGQSCELPIFQNPRQALSTHLWSLGSQEALAWYPAFLSLLRNPLLPPAEGQGVPVSPLVLFSHPFEPKVQEFDGGEREKVTNRSGFQGWSHYPCSPSLNHSLTPEASDE